MVNKFDAIVSDNEEADDLIAKAAARIRPITVLSHQ